MAQILKRIPHLYQIAYCRSPTARLGFRQTIARFCSAPGRLVDPYGEKAFRKEDNVPEGYELIYYWSDMKFGQHAHGVVSLLGVGSVIILWVLYEERMRTYNEKKQQINEEVTDETNMAKFWKLVDHFGNSVFCAVLLITYVPLISFLIAAIPCRVYFNKNLDMYIATFIRNAFKLTQVTVHRKDITRLWRYSETDIVKLNGRYAILRPSCFRTPQDFERMARLYDG